MLNSSSAWKSWKDSTLMWRTWKPVSWTLRLCSSALLIMPLTIGQTHVCRVQPHTCRARIPRTQAVPRGWCPMMLFTIVLFTIDVARAYKNFEVAPYTGLFSRSGGEGPYFSIRQYHSEPRCRLHTWAVWITLILRRQGIVCHYVLGWFDCRVMKPEWGDTRLPHNKGTFHGVSFAQRLSVLVPGSSGWVYRSIRRTWSSAFHSKQDIVDVLTPTEYWVAGLWNDY